ncbi:MAG: FAD:protein FMN transferase [Clostridia bacterium]|nr:FAD:protein FMN transferase [Clostridia bacterium]
MKKIVSLLLVCFVLFSLASCYHTPDDDTKEQVRSRDISTVYFNTYSMLSTYGDTSDDNIEKYLEISEEVLSYYHKLFDIYYEYAGVNNIRTINKNAGKSPVKVDEEMIDFLEYCKQIYTITNGKTNVMLGSVLKIWHECREIAEEDFGYLSPEDLPTVEELAQAQEHTSIDLLVIDRENMTVYISDPEASLDVGAVAKGYTVDILYERIKALGASSVVLNIGGSIRAIGARPNGSGWVVGITNPHRTPEKPFALRLRFQNTALVTSGDYERYFVCGEQKYHHIIDPLTGQPATYFSSVSILTEESGLADALSTALFCMSYEDGLALISSLREEGKAIEVLWIDREGNHKMTDALRASVVNA